MEYGGMGAGIGAGIGAGAITGGLGGGAMVALLPNTGGSLRFIAIASIISVVIGAVVIISIVARFVALRKLN